jgi:succinate dehydrogenase/fumarate reductase flavoprotein subunit
MLTVARLVIRGALAREETRGVHVRMDFPKTDNKNWRRHLAFRREEHK